MSWYYDPCLGSVSLWQKRARNEFLPNILIQKTYRGLGNQNRGIQCLVPFAAALSAPIPRALFPAPRSCKVTNRLCTIPAHANISPSDLCAICTSRICYKCIKRTGPPHAHTPIRPHTFTPITFLAPVRATPFVPRCLCALVPCSKTNPPRPSKNPPAPPNRHFSPSPRTLF